MLFVLLCWIFVCFCYDWDCDTVMTDVPLFLPILPSMSVLFTHRCQYNEIWCECHTSERFCAIKPGLIHHFLQKKMSVPSRQYDSCCPFVWCVLSFDFAIWLGTFHFEFSSEFSIFCNFTINNIFFWYFLDITVASNEKCSCGKIVF